MTELRARLRPGPRDPALTKDLSNCIERIVQALEEGADTSALMAEHNRIAGRSDIPAERYESLYASMSAEEAAEEALAPVAECVPGISRGELEALAALIVEPDDFAHQTYYLALFEANTPHGNSDLFFWPDPDWLKELGTNEPTPSQYVDKALKG
ncbi:hypothetical protein [Gymnodinialimonas hymeniacidonis]|uniref:hypothetical protein n=1 Tax=Gymnodinialimonas hymeniacidonis TaxID=3126508 RepID=UPI0034C6032C